MIIEKVGVVVSDKMNQTRVVRTERLVSHQMYKKVLKVRKKFYAHDENNQSKIGDKVRIQAIRPMSRLKRWKLVEIIKG